MLELIFNYMTCLQFVIVTANCHAVDFQHDRKVTSASFGESSSLHFKSALSNTHGFLGVYFSLLCSEKGIKF